MRSLLRAFALTASVFTGAGCANMNIYSDEDLEPLSLQAYQEATNEHGLVTSGPQYEMVQRVAQKISRAADEPKFKWEARLMKADDTVNAFCLPNGRIAVYTGLLKVADSEAMLAVVMGHEVAHATKRHGGIRMTQGTFANATTELLDAGLGMTSMDPEVKKYTLMAFGYGTQVAVLLPYSRDHESEADVEGLRYAIRAGYDPNVAVQLWERMAKLDSGGTPGWLSTHPKSEDRAKTLRDMIPQLLEQEKNWQPKPQAPAAAPGAPASNPPTTTPAKDAPANTPKK